MATISAFLRHFEFQTKRGITAIDPQMAEAAIEARVSRQPAETRPLAGCLRQTLRQDVYAERDNPPFDRVCMDGIAIRSDALSRGVRRFALQATQPAGAPALTLEDVAAAIEVMTGAMLPVGTDCVIPLEEYDLDGRIVTLTSSAQGEPDRNVQRRGSDSRPGVPMLRAGVRLHAPEIAVVASAGLAAASVSRQPRFMVVSTGDELIEPGQPIAPHQVRRSNAYAIVAALTGHGFEEVRTDHLLDDERLLRERLAEHLALSDVLILSGGVSKGKFDFVPKVLKELGVAEVFYQVAQRPGMPMWFGVSPSGCAVFGLPGNPIATLVCLVRYVVPALLAAMGTQRRVPVRIALAAPIPRGRPMASFIPVTVQYDDQGHHLAHPHQPNGSGDFLALAGTDGFVELPPQAAPYPAGFVATLYRW
ncbi:MAG TPA: molybdopterin molybdotransferase MoeA [Steroidobacteraceae bacterium]